MTNPEWIVKYLDKDIPDSVEFESIFPSRDRIEHLTLLWDTNSYHLNVAERFFIVNGGRRLRPQILEEWGVCRLLAVRRWTRELSMTGDQVRADSARYLLGFVGSDESEQLFVHVAEDGASWAWEKKR